MCITAEREDMIYVRKYIQEMCNKYYVHIYMYYRRARRYDGTAGSLLGDSREPALVHLYIHHDLIDEINSSLYINPSVQGKADKVCGKCDRKAGKLSGKERESGQNLRESGRKMSQK